MILLIDNYDSFTWNLYQYFCELGADVLVKRKVKLSEPEPMLRQQVEEILEGKPVRLARIVSFYRQAAEGSVEEEVLTAGLQEMNPLQIVKATFENSYQAEMPEELVNLFQEACRTINLE